jgi:2-isopropylmalate synthase
MCEPALRRQRAPHPDFQTMPQGPQTMQESELIYDWNTLEGSFDYSTRRGVQLNDETLRDGLQSPSVHDPSVEDKIRLLHLMDELGIASADIGLPGAGPRAVHDVEALAREIVDGRLAIQPNCAARTVRADVQPIIDISQRVGIGIEVASFIGSSPIRQYAEDWTLDRMLRATEDTVGFAVEHGLPVMYVTEDTTRAAPEVVKALYKTAIECGARRICVCDTVGHATPHGVRQLIRFIFDEVVRPSGEDVKVDWHGHRDRGLAIPNCLAAIEAGAHRIHGTALGIGERCGNAEMDLLLVNLKLLGLHDWDVSRLNEYVARIRRGRVPHRDRRARGGHHQGGEQGRRVAGGPHLLRRSRRVVRPAPGDRDLADERHQQRALLAALARLRRDGRGAVQLRVRGRQDLRPHLYRRRGARPLPRPRRADGRRHRAAGGDGVMAADEGNGVDVYGLPYCTTCQKAVGYLEDQKGVTIRSFRNLKDEPLSTDEVRGLAVKVGGVEKLFSKRAMKYRAMGLHEREVPEDEMVKLMSEEYTFVTRPVIVRGDRATAGFSARRVDELVGASA